MELMTPDIPSILTAPAPGAPTVHWAMAGRDLAKLEAVRQELPEARTCVGRYVMTHMRSMVLDGAGIFAHMFAQTTAPSFVRKYTSTMEHMGDRSIVHGIMARFVGTTLCMKWL